METKLRIYQDSKELPLFNYRRIIQTGDFFYMIKGYQPGDTVESDLKIYEDKFNELNREFVYNTNEQNQEMSDYASYVLATIEYNKLSAIYQIIELLHRSKIQLNELGIYRDDDEIHELVKDALKGVKIERSEDLSTQLIKLKNKICFYESNIEKYKALLSENGGKENQNDDFDLDDQLLSVCLGLEIAIPDEHILTLYQYNLLVKKLIEKIKALEKNNA